MREPVVAAPLGGSSAIRWQSSQFGQLFRCIPYGGPPRLCPELLLLSVLLHLVTSDLAWYDASPCLNQLTCIHTALSATK